MRRRLLAVALLALAAAGAKAADPVSEYEVKAAFLYNFAKFVDWPAEALPPGAPFVVTVLGADPFEGVLDRTLAGKSVAGHPVTVRHAEDLDAVGRPHILFVADVSGRSLSRVLEKVREAPVLTVADSAGFAQRGVMVNFVLRQRRVRFEINLSEVERAHLKISSQLLQLATLVNGR